MKIYTHEEMPQGSDDWISVRLGKFTCSDAQAILTNGKGLETLAFTKAAEIKTGKSADSYSSDAMERGKELEELARSAYEIESGEVVTRIGFILHSLLIGGSPDGLVADDGLVEIKCPCDRVFVEYLYYEKVDPKYLAQMQMQLLISERQWVDYTVFNPNFEKSIVIKRIERNEEMIEKLRVGLAKGEEQLKKILEKLGGVI